MRGYKERNIPLDVLVIDMDWHITFYSAGQKDQVPLVGIIDELILFSLVPHMQAGERKGWTGFTWDKHLFPSPKLFLDWYDEHRGKVRCTVSYRNFITVGAKLKGLKIL